LIETISEISEIEKLKLWRELKRRDIYDRLDDILALLSEWLTFAGTGAACESWKSEAAAST